MNGEARGAAPANRLAEYAVSLRFEDLPAPTVHEAKRRFIDSFATAVGAMDADVFHIVRRVAQTMQSTPPGTMLGGGNSSIEWATSSMAAHSLPRL